MRIQDLCRIWRHSSVHLLYLCFMQEPNNLQHHQHKHKKRKASLQHHQHLPSPLPYPETAYAGHLVKGERSGTKLSLLSVQKNGASLCTALQCSYSSTTTGTPKMMLAHIRQLTCEYPHFTISQRLGILRPPPMEGPPKNNCRDPMETAEDCCGDY